ncbi:class I SAM-dependent methyltransferase [Streptomyces sp. NPDC049597]|uniref:SAM-dependent methyltransferase n=1 Tax=Streptomyces sp. NPDC049597 TaxID=3155276 RepID=UPI0034153597
MTSVPQRLAWAVEQLDVRPDDRVLEIGCGPGVALDLVAGRLTTGTVTAIDRSAHAVDAARRRNRAHIADGRAEVRQLALAELPPDGDRFDKIFAVNVNVFWTSPADREVALLRGLLAPGGTLSLFYEPPAHGRARELEGILLPKLTWPGATTVISTGRTEGSTLLGVQVTVD